MKQRQRACSTRQTQTLQPSRNLPQIQTHHQRGMHHLKAARLAVQPISRPTNISCKHFAQAIYRANILRVYQVPGTSYRANSILKKSESRINPMAIHTQATRDIHHRDSINQTIMSWKHVHLFASGGKQVGASAADAQWSGAEAMAFKKCTTNATLQLSRDVPP